jgi:hypothetical protein
MTGIVRRKLRSGVIDDVEQIANRVPVLHTVKPVHRDATGVRISRVYSKRRMLDPVFQNLLLLGVRPWFAGRWHDAGTDILEHAPPELLIVQPLFGRLDVLEGDTTLLRSVVVARTTVFLEDRLDARYEGV